MVRLIQPNDTASASGHKRVARAGEILLAIIAFTASLVGAILSVALLAVPFVYRFTDVTYWRGHYVTSFPVALLCAVVGLNVLALTYLVFDAGRSLMRRL